MTKLKYVSADGRAADYKTYQNASHETLIELTRSLIALPLGDLIKLHKDKAKEVGATAPSAVFVRAVLFTRLANNQIRGTKNA